MDIHREMDAFRAALVARGLAVTRQRIKLAEAVFSTHTHFAADDLAELARKRGARVGRVTAYRTLALMVEAGLVEERRFRKDRVLYEHTFGHRHHDHMVCILCGRIIEFECPRIEREQQAAARRHGFRILHHSHTLFGHCPSCGKGRRAPRRPRRGSDGILHR